VQRRSLLKLGLSGSLALALVGGGAALLYQPAWRKGRLTDSGRSVLGGVARAVLDGSLPADAGPQAIAIVAHLERMDATLQALPASTQRDVSELLALLATAPGRLALAGLSTDWLSASAEQIQGAMQFMRTSRIDLRLQAYHALRDLTHAAYFSSQDTWARLGYPGPMVIVAGDGKP
jgi:hypothetical protein